jgi:signal transduction histidine kinase/ActR/RegA family two-component response regulator
VFETGGIVEREMVNPADGREREVRAFPIVDAEGRVQMVVEHVRDITDRKRAEEEKDKLRARLQQAHKMEAVGTLAGGIAHDFNNLLQALNGYSEILLLDKKQDHSDYKHLKAIELTVDRATHLVKQLLLFSRKAESEPQPVDLREAIENATHILERTIPKMVSIEAHTDDRPWTVNADPIQIEQVLLNLATNAADAMPEGGRFVIETQNITLDLEDTRHNADIPPGPYVLLTVSDTGHGMDRATLEKIYEPFFTTKDFGQGTGLGLASVYGIVKNHGGHIACYSEIGQGTTFKIHLPAIQKFWVNPDAPPAVEPSQGGGETVLVADDEEHVRDIAQQALGRYGYSVLTASTGEEALTLYSENKEQIDLVLLDLGMPGMGGRRCLHKLLEMDPSVKVIIASGYSINGQVKETMREGAVGYVAKPYAIKDLLKEVQAALGGQ